MWAFSSFLIINFYIIELIGSTVIANHPPKFVLNGESEILLQLREGADTPVGSVIYTVHGEDDDGDGLSFGVDGAMAPEYVRVEPVNSNEANIVLITELDRETKDEYSFVLTLTDGNLGDGNYITQSMIILVLDVNDNEPVFKSYNSSVLVKEDASPGEIVTVEATDRDEGPFGQVLYELQEPDGKSGKFQIQTLNGKGVVSLIQDLDYEKINIYQLEILAKDQPSFGRRNTATAAILIKVVDVEDQPPQFIHVPSITRIPENLAQGSLVLEVKAIDGDRGINKQISYSLEEVNEHKGLFVIHPSTGQVFVRGTLDRETEGFLDGYILQIDAFEVNSSVYPVPSASTEVTVILLDVNDETPTFANDSYVGDVVENAQINVPVRFTSGLAEVVDYDQGKNGTFRLFLDGENGIFDVSPHEGINEVTFLIRVKNSSLLDYEKTKKIDFKIVAQEIVATGAKSSSANVTVYIQDSNDNIPRFAESEYVARIPENASLGASVVKIQAHDVDSGQFGSAGVRYTQINGQIADKLHLDRVTGLVTVGTADHGLDREVVSQYFLTVEARDDDGSGNSNSVKLVVYVDDVNDNRPYFTEEKYERKLHENQLKFATPLIVHAHDKDLNGTANSNVTYSIVETAPPIDISINSTSGEMELNSPLDFEQFNDTGDVRIINVTIRASDQGQPPLHSDVAVTLFLMDVNDNIPTFESSFYSASIPEDTASGRLVLKVHANDSDSSSNFGRVIYQMENGFHDKFVVDPQTGAISVAPGANLDLDLTAPKTDFYSFRVVAMDGGIGAEQKSSSVLVSVNVTDVNNKLPEFKELGIVHVLENRLPGEIVANLTATDADTSADLKYAFDPSKCEARNEDGALVKDFEVSNTFDLDPDTGTIRLSRSLDRETMETVKLLAIVVDVGANSNTTQTATTTLTIKIDDVNDNPPFFRKPNYQQAVLENSKVSTHILTVVAYDTDSNKTVSYSLNGNSNVTNLIKLDPTTGDVSVANKIDRERFDWLNFTVLATDTGIPPKASVVNVTIQVLDENDNNPIFELSETNFSIPEDADPGTKVGIVRATDADSGSYGKITYILDAKTSVGKFTIDPNLGVLVVADKLDREIRDGYNLIIEAWDNYQYGFSNRESRNAFKQVYIKIIDVNDEIPTIKPHNECAFITEYHKTGETIRTIHATDNDEPNSPNSRMQFTITDGDPNGLFDLATIDTKSARLIASKPLKQFVGNFTLTVKITDNGLPPLFSTSDLRVCVTDFNDHAPIFVRPSQNFTIRVAEDAKIGSTLIRVEAEDSDTGSNGVVKYRLKNDSFGHWRSFAIDPDDGTMTLSVLLDREKQKLYQIRVVAYDLGVPTALATDLDLNVYVRNVNDVEPRFAQTHYEIHLIENSDPGSDKRVLPRTIDEEAYDEDEKRTDVCYYIISGNEENLFDLDKFSHELGTVLSLDRESAAEHRLAIAASEDCVQDPTNPPETSTMNLTIKVDDVNDNPPIFLRRVFTGGVTTEAQFGAVVLRLTAHDRDSGDNAKLSYRIDGPVTRRLTEGVRDEIGAKPFAVNATSGEIKLNFDPQKGMKGYFDFNVLVNDTGGFYDTATVYIYLLRADQRVKFVVRLTPEELREKIDYFRDVLGNITNAIVNVDTYKYHSHNDGTVDKRKSDLYAHFVRRTDNTIMDVNNVLSLIDESNEFLVALYQDLNVIESRPAEDDFLFEPEDLVRAWLIGLSVFLGAMLVLVVTVCLAQRSKYERKLRAATATAFGSQDSGLNRMDLPNTNQHSVEGSNPIWMQSYTNEWYKDEDSLR